MIKFVTARRAATAFVVTALVATLGLGASASGARADSTPAPAPLNFHTYAPAIASDASTPQPATPSPLVAIQNVSTWVPGGLWVYGEVHNGLTGTISNVTVTATALDSTGSAVISRTEPILIDQVGTGSNGPFRILLAGALDPSYTVQTAVAGYQLSSTASLNDQISYSPPVGPQDLIINTPDPVTHTVNQTVSNDLKAITGTITNNSAQAITSPSVFVAIYDSSGKLAMVSSTSLVSTLYQDPSVTTVVLQPAETGNYSVTVPYPDINELHVPLRMVVFLAAAPTPPPGS